MTVVAGKTPTLYRIDDPGFEPVITDNGHYMLRFRYLQTTPEGERETPAQLFRRVAWNLAEAERLFRPNMAGGQVKEWAERFFRLMTDFRFLPNAPTLLGAGHPLQQLFACFVLPVGDSIDEVFDAVRMAALVHSKGGGTGFSFSSLRGRGTPIATGGVSSGAVSFIRLFDAETEVIKAGGTGWGANMGVLRCDHPDIREFITAKSGRDGLHNFNLSVGITDAFMRLYRSDGVLPLIDSHSGEVTGRIPARELLDAIAGEAWKTGDPGLLFLDRINQDNPTPALGPIEATNPCGEAPLLSYEACCLGGLNVVTFLDASTGRIRWGELRQTAALALRLMDNVMEASRFPLEAIGEATRRTRKIGIGIMGFADLLIGMGVPYNSDEAVRVAEELMRTVQEATHEASVALAEERGSFPAFAGSLWEQRGYRGIRNATTTSNAPNSTISVIAGCSAGIEPLFAVGYDKRLANGDRLREIHPGFVQELKRRGLFSERLLDEVCGAGTVQELNWLPDEVKRIYVTSHDVEPEWHVRIQSAFQGYTDLGISKTINLPNTATPDDVKRAFVLAYETGCKGITCFRDGCLDTQFLGVADCSAPDACEICQ